MWEMRSLNTVAWPSIQSWWARRMCDIPLTSRNLRNAGAEGVAGAAWRDSEVSRLRIQVRPYEVGRGPFTWNLWGDENLG